MPIMNGGDDIGAGRMPNLSDHLKSLGSQCISFEFIFCFYSIQRWILDNGYRIVSD